ncbi:hypothetical protein VNO77_21448 [Canavalia gladiata]|uniref:Uncharacterized protein n=1 Tax=Canavalia gladiata TaxID=3824 RepID=A0AAN9LRB4_CANGL
MTCLCRKKGKHRDRVPTTILSTTLTPSSSSSCLSLGQRAYIPASFDLLSVIPGPQFFCHSVQISGNKLWLNLQILQE